MIGQLLTGRYLILEKLGAGGFSETYLARDKYLPHHPLCVVKYLKLSSSNKISLEAAQRLFETEARLLEQLGRNYPQIPTLFAYCHEQEQMYLIQEYIEGESLSKWLVQGKHLTPKTAIALLMDVLTTLNYIHSQRVIHRDIKPSNLIRRHRDGKVVLIDFGAACLLPEAELSHQPDSPDSPLAIGTPGYMPDEQHSGLSQFNSDLYALGMLVIHLLTGVKPQQFHKHLISGELDWQLYLKQQAIQPELIAILKRMVQINFRDRYQQAADVLADLKALSGTKRSSAWGVVPSWRKGMRRVLLPVATILLLGVVGGKYVLAYSTQTESLWMRLEQMLHRSTVQFTRVRDFPVPAGIERMLIAPNNQVLITAGTDHVLRLWSLPTGALRKSLAGHRAAITALTISQDGRWLVSGSEDGTVRLWSVASGQLLQTFREAPQPVTAVAIRSDAQVLVSGSKGGTLCLWNLQTGVRQQTLKLSDAEVSAVVFGATPDSLISASSDRKIQIWDLRNGQILRTFAGHTDAIVGLYVADDHTLFSFGKDRGFVWDLNREELVWVFSEKSADPMTVSFHHQHLMTIHPNGKLRVWTRSKEQVVTTGVGQLGRNLQVTISPDQSYVASWSSNQPLRLWRVNTTAVNQAID